MEHTKIISIKVPYSLYEWVVKFSLSNEHQILTITSIFIAAIAQYKKKYSYLNLQQRPLEETKRYVLPPYVNTISEPKKDIRLRISHPLNEWLRNYIFYLKQQGRSESTITSVFLEALEDFKQIQ